MITRTRRTSVLMAVILGIVGSVAVPATAVTATLDPAMTLTDFVSLGEWNTNGDFEGWTTSQVSSPNVLGGSLNGGVADNSNDPKLILNNISGLGIDLDSGDFDVVEMRISRRGTDGRVDLFWGTTVANGFSGTRRVDDSTASLPVDGQFHVIQWDMSDESAWTATLDDVRIDPFSGFGTGRSFQVDYVRVGSIAPAVPEPATATIAMLGLGGLMMRRRRITA